MNERKTKKPDLMPASQNIHKHEFLYQETVRSSNHINGYQYKYIKVDLYYCKYCLEQKEVRKETSSIEKPEWY